VTDTPEVSEIFTVPRRDVGSGGTRRLDVNVIAATVAVAQACQVRAKQDECTPRRLQTANRILGQRRLTPGAAETGIVAANRNQLPRSAPDVERSLREPEQLVQAAFSSGFSWVGREIAVEIAWRFADVKRREPTASRKRARSSLVRDSEVHLQKVPFVARRCIRRQDRYETWRGRRWIEQ